MPAKRKSTDGKQPAKKAIKAGTQVGSEQVPEHVKHVTAWSFGGTG